MTDEDVEELKQQVTALEARLDAYQTKFERLLQLVCDDPDEFGTIDVAAEEAILSRLDDHDDRITEAEDDVARAIASARVRAADGGEGKTKVGIAEEIARNEVVRRAAKNQNDARVKATKVQELARPQHELAYQTVKDALRNLSSQWRELRVRKDPRALELGVNQVTRELTAVVDDDLASLDATKLLISEEMTGRGSE